MKSIDFFCKGKQQKTLPPLNGRLETNGDQYILLSKSKSEKSVKWREVNKKKIWYALSVHPLFWSFSFILPITLVGLLTKRMFIIINVTYYYFHHINGNDEKKQTKSSFQKISFLQFINKYLRIIQRTLFLL